jgi:hypothetical protein
VLVLPVTVMIAQEEESASRVQTNLEVFQKLSHQVGDSVAFLLNQGDSVRLIVRPIESAWYVEGVIWQVFSQRGVFPTQSSTARNEVELGLVRAQVEYVSVRRAGLFSSKIVDRKVNVEFLVKVVDDRLGQILVSRTFVNSALDVVEVSDIERLENSGIPATHGVLPKEGFFSTFLEPLVAIGAMAVAVYLLFHVRS